MPLFRVVFSGLSAIVPRGGVLTDPRDLPSSLTIILPNILKPCVLPYAHLILPSHFPLLEFSLDNHLVSGDQPSFLAFRKPEEGSRGACLLERREISFLRDGKKLPDGVQPVRRPPTLGGEEPEEEDISWLVELEAVSEIDCWIKPEYLRSLSPLERNVVTRVQLSGGMVRTFELHEDEWLFTPLEELIRLLLSRYKVPEYVDLDRIERRVYCDMPELAPIPPAWSNFPTRKLATKMAFEFEFEREVSVVIKGFGGRNPRRLVLTPADGRPADDIEIVISNLEADELLGVPVEERYGGDIDPDFAVYYRLVEFRADEETQRRLTPRVLVRKAAGGYGKPCSPTRILESEGAAVQQAFQSFRDIPRSTEGKGGPPKAAENAPPAPQPKGGKQPPAADSPLPSSGGDRTEG